MMKIHFLILLISFLMIPVNNTYSKTNKYKFKNVLQKEKKAQKEKKKKTYRKIVYKTKPPLEPQAKKTPIVLKKKKIEVSQEEPAIYNDFKKYIMEDEEDYNEDWYGQKPASKGTLTGDFSTFGSEIKGVMKKHQFTILGVPYSIQGVPIVYPSKKTGLNLGARLSVYDLKYDDPYRFNIMMQYWVSDRGRKKHELKFETPRFFSKNWELVLRYTYTEDIDKNFFGIGNDSIFNTDFVKVNSSSYLSKTFYQYRLIYPRFTLDLRFKIPKQNFSLFTGLGIDKATIKPYDEGIESNVSNLEPYGFGGGKTNFVKTGLMYDTRDYPTNPAKGNVAILTYTNHGSYLKSDYNFNSINLTQMCFYSFWKYFTFGQRFILEQLYGDLPFFALSGIYSTRVYEGLGGSDLLRGYPNSRYIDKAKLVNQIELRIKFYNGKVFGQHLKMDTVPFWDFGRVYNDLSQFTFKNINHSFGNSFRLTWNKNFLMAITFGKSRDALEAYFTFGEPFK